MAGSRRKFSEISDAHSARLHASSVHLKMSKSPRHTTLAARTMLSTSNQCAARQGVGERNYLSPNAVGGAESRKIILFGGEFSLVRAALADVFSRSASTVEETDSVTRFFA
jgi:hypothetical protein